MADDTGATQSVAANTTVSLSDSPKLDVADTAGAPLASSEDLVADFPLFDAALRLITIFPYSSPADTIQIRATGLSFTNTTSPKPLVITLLGSATNKPQDISLAPKGPNTFENLSVSLSSAVSLDPTLGGTIKTSYAASDTLNREGKWLRFFDDLLATGAAAEFWKTPRLSLGQFRLYDGSALIGQTKKDDLDKAIATPENLACTGYEQVTVTIDPQKNQGLSIAAPLTAKLKVRHPSTTMFISGHGNHDSAGVKVNVSYQSTQVNIISPMSGSFASADLSAVQTLIIDSCEALDFRDLNNNYGTGVTYDDGTPIAKGRTGPADPINQRFSPGQQWWKKTGGNTLLLGYNFPALGGTAFRAIQQFDAANAIVKASGLPSSQRPEPVVWLLAHAMAQGLDFKLAACAWDKDAYYYMSFKPPLQTLKNYDPKTKRKVEGFYRVPLDSNGDNTSVTADCPPLGLRPEDKLNIPIP